MGNSRELRLYGAYFLLTLSEGDVCWGARQEHLAREDQPVDA